jgi:thiol-disulfide isomerase/thioredoxin
LISSPDNDLDDFINNLSPTDNISPIKTLNDLQKSVGKNDKPVSIVLFYGRYCPYSKRTIRELRQWARANQDRIFLYEVDVEQASDLAEYYHVRSIPTIMAFEDNNLIAPIWQRTATNVLSSSIIEESKPTEETFDDSNNLDTILQQSESVHDIKQNEILSKTCQFSFLIFDIFRSR